MGANLSKLSDIEIEKIYYDLRLIALRVAQRILKNRDDAEDVAQTVCMKYLQNIDSIENSQAWVNRTAHNEAIDYAKRRNISYGDMGKIEVIQYNNSIKQEDIIGIEAVDLKEVKELLSPKDFQLYQLALKYNHDSGKIAGKLNKSTSYVYGATHRMKRNLSAAKYRKEGYGGSRKIVDFYMHRKILIFINKLVKKMKENRLASMHNYFRKIDTDKIPQLDIVETFTYNIHLLANGSYDVYIPYENSQGTINFCFLDFKTNQLSEIVITKFYLQPPVKLESEDVTLMDEFRVKRKGLHVQSKKEAKKIFNFLEDKTL